MPGGCIKILISYTKIDLGLHSLVSYFGKIPNPPKKYYSMVYFPVCIFLPSGDFISCTYNIFWYQGYPVSVGRAHITSGLDPYAKLDFEIGYLDEWVV